MKSLNSLVPMMHVRNVRRSVEFYEKLGFRVGNTHTPEGGVEPVWAWLESGGAHLMLAQAGEPVDAEKPAVLFYVYSADVDAFRSMLLKAGVEAGSIHHPFYAPGGEFRVTDPDGYILMVTHTLLGQRARAAHHRVGADESRALDGR
jgi:catechol 2,3-dioxygenase-like lactoylglutathione lyase family enzyme